MHLIKRTAPICLAALILATSVAYAQPPAAAPPCPCPPEPHGPWTGSAGFGLTLNRGNTDTTNLNLAFDATYDPKTKNVWKFKGLYLRGDNNGELAVDRFLFEIRNERDLNERVYMFGQLQFLKDHFKDIDYLWSPNGGIGYRLIATPATTLSADAGFGVKWEKNTGMDVRTDAVFTSSDKFEHKLSATAAITQSFNALWKADDFGDALYTFSAGIAASMTTRAQLKLEFLDAYASRPPSPGVKKNDTSLLASVVYKF